MGNLMDRLREFVEKENVLRREWQNMAPPICTHEGWTFETHGRVCWKCHEILVDWGD